MYSRGGWVWAENNEDGLVFLEEDWDGGQLPEDLVQEAGLMGTSFVTLNPNERARLAGYVKNGQFAHFIIDLNNFPQISKRDLKIYLASELNEWNGLTKEKEWELKADSRYSSVYKLIFKWEKLESLDPFSFKFVTEEGDWLEPQSALPCNQKNVHGTEDFIFNAKRTGKDILNFKLIKGAGSHGLEKWMGIRPKGGFGYRKIGNISKFRVFAPRVKQVDLMLSSSCKQNQFERHPMKKLSDGSWEIKVAKNCDGMFYKYAIHSVFNARNLDLFEKDVVDPYARAMVGRNGPGIALTINQTEPVHSFSIPKKEDLIILETHIRDLLVYAPLKLTDQEKLGFQGLTKWLNSKECYLRKLGVNAIELQPIHEFDARTKDEYHWGYMSVNFFSPASSYSSNPENGSAVSEFKDLVTALHDAGMAVIIDVVYNHVGVPAHLAILDRELYLSTDLLGELTNHSGCGNDINAQSQAVRKLVIDSLQSMVRDFNIDGFRFDLGELIGFDLLSEIENELLKSKPDLILIAEPWSFRGRLPVKMNQTNYSLWSDRCREKLLKYVQGDSNSNEMIQLLKGKIDQENYSPWQSIHYLESHDDLTFIDRLCSPKEWKAGRPPKSVVKRAEIAMAILLLSPGVPMLASGQDFLRSKKGVQNTYQRGDLNALKYETLNHCADFHEWTKKLISFRSSKDGQLLRLKEFLPDQQYAEIHGPENSFGLIIQFSPDDVNGLSLIIMVNPNKEAVSIAIPGFMDKKNKQILLGAKTKIFGLLDPISIQVWKVG